ncbi:MAG TPA: recombinase family protein, partial [Chitinophagaceae bacterium]
MKSAYIYVRVSTDEQRRQGYSLVEKEERLLKHCEINNIAVKVIFREDYSAKDFNRPEWKKLIKSIKKKKSGSQENVLFLKWDRFSRSIEYAYQMIGMLRDFNVQAKKCLAYKRKRHDDKIVLTIMTDQNLSKPPAYII